MKKISILLIFVMIISIIPALNVSAEDIYYLKGISEGEYIVANAEKTRTLTLVNIADKESVPGNVTGVDKVVFKYNNRDAVTDEEAPFEYNLVFDSCGIQTLMYEVYTSGSDTPISKSVNFTTIAGVKNTTYSYEENFSFLKDAKEFFGTNGNGVAVSGSACLYDIVDGVLRFSNTNSGKNATKQFAFKYAPVGTGSKVFHYSYEVTPEDSKYSLTLHKKFGTVVYTLLGIGECVVGNSNKVNVIIDFNSNIATVRLNGKEVRRVDISDFSTGDPIFLANAVNGKDGVSFEIDNFNFVVYDTKPHQEFSYASIPGGEENPVVTNLSEIRITGNDFLENQDLTDIVLVDNNADFTSAIDGNDVVVTFNSDLSDGTTYTLTIDGIKDTDLLSYKTYSLTFRTLNPGENLPPEVRIISLKAEKRFYPGDTITLSAEASDGNGSISYVEFYCNGELIQGSRQETSIDGVYTYEWIADSSYESIDLQSITVLACDDEGSKVTSSPVKIKILSMLIPEVEITSPENEKTYILNFGGVKTDVKPTISIVAEDLDGEIANMDILIDGENVYSGALRTEYTPENSLSIGEHIVRVEVTDNDSQINFDEIVLSVESRAKSGFILRDELATTDLLSKYDKVGTVKNGNLSSFEDVKGIIITSDNPSSVVKSSVKRTCTYSLEGKSFGIDVKLAFGDTLSQRKVLIDSKELITFEAGGKILFAGSEKGNYDSGIEYNLSTVVDYDNLKLYVLLDGELLGNIAISATDFTSNEVISIIHTGAVGEYSETAVTGLSISKMSSEVVVPTVKLYSLSGNVLETNTSINADDINYITVEFEGGADGDSIKNNLLIINNETNKRVNVNYSSGKFILSEHLKYASDYTVLVLPDARNSKEFGYSGVYELSFTTNEPTNAVGVKNVEISGESLNEGVYSATLKVDFNGIGEVGKKVTVVYSAFIGSKMIASVPTEITVGTALADASIPVSISGVNEDTVIEVFVVDNMTNLNPINDKIFVIKSN